MGLIQLSLLVVGGLALGAAILQYLTVHPLKMDRYLLAASLLGFMLVAGVLVWFDGWQRLAAVAAALVAVLAGYWLMTRRFLAREDERPVPALTRQKGDPGQRAHGSRVFYPRRAGDLRPHRLDQPVPRVRRAGHPIRAAARPPVLRL